MVMKSRPFLLENIMEITWGERMSVSLCSFMAGKMGIRLVIRPGDFPEQNYG